MNRVPEHLKSTHILHTSILWPLNFVRDFPGEPVPEPIWILLKQETVSDSWAICKSAPHYRQTTMAASHHSIFKAQMPFLLPNQQRTEGIPHLKSITTYIVNLKQVEYLMKNLCKINHMKLTSMSQ